MNAEIIAVGTELLLGDIVNTNAQFIAKQLADLGISVFFQTVVGDNEARLSAAYALAFERADLVITTGGLGPTKDDLTKETAAKVFGLPLALHEETLQAIRTYFATQNLKITQNNEKQAYILEGATVLANENGTAPGCLLERDGKILILLPGPPREMQPMFRTHVLPFLSAKTDQVIVSKTMRLCGIGESRAEEMLKPLLEDQSNPTIAPYAKSCEVHFRVTARAADEEVAWRLIQPVSDEIRRLLGDYVYGEDETTLEAAVIGILRERGMTIACAESCTGGMLTARLVNCPGASAVLLEGAVTYSNDAKVKRLGVKAETLAQYGAVSRETAAEMAQGIALTAGADVGVGITGVAGPDGGTDEKPVGMVFIAVCARGVVHMEALRVVGDRERVRTRATVTALNLIRACLKNPI